MTNFLKLQAPRIIYKYKIPLSHDVKVVMPVGAEILSIQDQAGDICIWAMVRPDSDKRVFCFTIFGTGHDISDEYKGKYISTVKQGMFVWHVFQDEEQ